jgi:hypothetical protein
MNTHRLLYVFCLSFFILFCILNFSPTVFAATVNIKNDSLGGDCSSIGVWDAQTKTCTLNQDTGDIIKIQDSDLNFDGAGFRVLNMAPSTGDYTAIRAGIWIQNAQNIEIRNVSTTPIAITNSASTTLKNVKIENIYDPGGPANLFAVFVDLSSDFKIFDSKIINNEMGIYFYSSDGLWVENNEIRGNQGGGIQVGDTSDNATIVHNNFYYQPQAVLAERYSSNLPKHQNIAVYQNNFFGQGFPAGDIAILHTWESSTAVSQDLPLGGNYYEYFTDSTAYGIPLYSCSDANNDQICDEPYSYRTILNKIQTDYFPWKEPNAWIKKNIPPAGGSNVLFIPGLEASRLYKLKANCTINCEDQLWEPNAKADLEDLYLNADGTSKNADIYTKDIIKETNTPIPTGILGQNIYKGFAETMDSLVTNGKINSWKAFAYDWRQSADNIINSPQKNDAFGSTSSLIDTLSGLASTSQNGKVTIITHSNGGFVAKELLRKLEDDKAQGKNDLIDKVDVLILVASPQLGTPSAIPALLHGFDQRILLGWLLDESHARELGRNMPSAYGLIPGEKYMQETEVAPVSFKNSVLGSEVIASFFNSYGTTTDTYTDLQNFLLGSEGRANPEITDIKNPIKLSSALLSEAKELHEKIDNWVPPANLKVIQVAGWGIDTLAGFEYSPKLDCVPNANTSSCDYKYILDERPIFTVDGDKTVVTPSALGMPGEKWWLDLNRYNNGILGGIRHDRYHEDILGVNELLNFIKNLIQKNENQENAILVSTKPNNFVDTLRLSVHSPVTIDVYDQNGNHTGKICPINYEFCYVEENIPNSSYLEFGEGKYLNLPESKADIIKLIGTGIGTFTFESEKVYPNGTSTITKFIDIPVTNQTVAEVKNGLLNVDVDGDGASEFVLQPQTDFDPILYLQIIKKTIDKLDLPQNKKEAFGKKVDKIINQIQKGKIDKAKSKIQNISNNLTKKLQKQDTKYQKPGKLSKTDAQLLLDMFTQLLDNLN